MEKRSLQGLRADNRMTQLDVAKAVNINLTTYQSYEAFKSLPNIKKANEIAKLLGVTNADIKWYEE